MLVGEPLGHGWLRPAPQPHEVAKARRCALATFRRSGERPDEIGEAQGQYEAPTFGALQAVTPGPGLGPVGLFLAEAIPPLVIFTVVIAISVGLTIALLAGVSGASINAARQFGPALLSGQTADLWIYLTVPVLAPLLVALVVRALRAARPVTA